MEQPQHQQQEPGNGKENVDPNLTWHGIDEAKDISTDSLEPQNFPQVIDTNSETSNSFLFDRSIGPALVGTTSSVDSTNLGGGPIREDGDAKGSTTPTGIQTDRQSLIDNRETEEYADGLARDLLNSTTNSEDLISNQCVPIEEKQEDEEETEGGKVDTNSEVKEENTVEEEKILELEEKEKEQLVEQDKEDPLVEEIKEELVLERIKEKPIIEEIEEEPKLEEEIQVRQEEVEVGKDVQGVKVEENKIVEEILQENPTNQDIIEEVHENIITDSPTVESAPPLAEILTDYNNDVQKSDQIESDNCFLVDCGKQEEGKMEFTKNYSDDLLMGQSDPGAHKGETMMPSADLADFELPPYSGSSSGSEPPRQHSPVKRQSSSNSSAAQPTSSHQTNVESSSSPNLSAVKNLLMSSYSRISHILYWKRPIESGIIFAAGMTIIMTLTFFSIISVFAYSALGVILASALIRFYKAVMKALSRSSDLPFDHLWNKAQGFNVSLSLEKTHELVDASLGNLNASLLYFKQVLLFEEKIATVKVSLTYKFGLSMIAIYLLIEKLTIQSDPMYAKCGLFLYMLTYIGAWFNGMTLITISYLALFSVPLFYQKNKTKIDEYLNTATGQLSSTISLVTNKASSIAFGASSSSSANKGTSSKKQD